MKIIPAKEAKKPPRSKLAVSMKVTIGPEVSTAKTMGQLSQDLRDAAKRHPKSFLKAMFQHFADHIDAAVPLGGQHAPNAPAKLSFDVVYYGADSCSGCGGNDCCLCINNGVQGCEEC